MPIRPRTNFRIISACFSKPSLEMFSRYCVTSFGFFDRAILGHYALLWHRRKPELFKKLIVLVSCFLNPFLRFSQFLMNGSERMRQEAAREVMDIYAPLAKRLGLWQLKWELEDLSLRALEPPIGSCRYARRTRWHRASARHRPARGTRPGSWVHGPACALSRHGFPALFICVVCRRSGFSPHRRSAVRAWKKEEPSCPDTRS